MSEGMSIRHPTAFSTSFSLAGESSSKKIRYTLCDNLYRFYFRFIPSSLSLIELGMGERVYDTVIFPLMADYFGHIFEEVCIQYIEALMKKGEIAELYTEFGKWWQEIS